MAQGLKMLNAERLCTYQDWRLESRQWTAIRDGSQSDPKILPLWGETGLVVTFSFDLGNVYLRDRIEPELPQT